MSELRKEIQKLVGKCMGDTIIHPHDVQKAFELLARSINELQSLREQVDAKDRDIDTLIESSNISMAENQQLHQRLEKYQGALKKIAAKKGHALQRIDGEHCQQIAREALQRLKESE